MKPCSKCKTEKPFSDFGKRKDSKDGLSHECFVCARTRSAAYSDLHRKEIAEKTKAWGKRNAEKKAAANKEWALLNKEKMQTYKKKWREENAEAANQRAKDRYGNDVESARANGKRWANNRRARLNQTIGVLSVGLAAKLFKLQRGKCACGCRQPLGADYHLDHRMPLALGGTNTDDNIQLLTATCNRQKHAKHPIDFMQSRGFLL